MFINPNLGIIKRKGSGDFVLVDGHENTLNTFYKASLPNEKYTELERAYDSIKAKTPPHRYECEKEIELFLSFCSAELVSDMKSAEVDPAVRLEKALSRLISFFTEFQFEPNFRFVNSFSLALAKSDKNGREYVKQYFELIDSPYSKEVAEKIKSAEFKDIISELKTATPSKTINSRFKLYYGSQGTGKTTIAMEETEGRCMVCNSSMLPADLMEDFVFVDGKATFKPSALWRSMVEGTKIVLDELNLLPFDSLRFLQTILDGKKQFLYKGNLIEIAEGFQIIGTMNLVVNGMTYGLPEPLVDRCAETRKFSLSAKDLVSALM